MRFQSKAPPEEKARRIGSDLGISPITVAGIGIQSSSKVVRFEANRAYNKFREENLGITQKWLSLINLYPNLKPVDRAKRIGKELGIKARTVAGYGIHSENEKVRSEANKAYYQIRKKEKLEKLN